MASVKAWVTKRLQEVACLAHYYHCAMQALKLSTSTINSVATVRNALGIVETVVVFVTDSRNAVSFSRRRRKRPELEWHTSVQRFCEHIAATLDSLQMIAWSGPKTSSKASTLLNAMATSGLLVGIVISKALAGLLMGSRNECLLDIKLNNNQ